MSDSAHEDVLTKSTLEAIQHINDAFNRHEEEQDHESE
jgi:hypothetical protein